MAIKFKEKAQSSFPSWKELLNRAAARLNGEQKIHEASVVRGLVEINPPRFLEAAKFAKEYLGSIWTDFLLEQFDLPAADILPETLSLPKRIWNLGSNLVITTNFDDALLWAYPGQPKPKIWEIENVTGQSRYIRDEHLEPTIWHLHGHIGNPARLILTSEGYDALYAGSDQSSKYQAALETLKIVIASRSLLFVGFSLEDEHFGFQLKDLSRIYQNTTGPHYVLIRKRHLDYARTLKMPVELIAYEDFGEPLERLLAEMTAVLEPQVSSVVSSSNPILAEEKLRAASDPVFSLPYRSKGDRVVGRQSALMAVRNQLTNGQPTAIGQTAAFQGLGGLGKTQLAVEYCYAFREHYPAGVIWLNVDQNIEGQLIQIAEQAGWVSPAATNEHKLAVALRMVRKASDCLIVFDNLDSTDSIAAYLPEASASPHLLITSRQPQPGFTEVPLHLLSVDDSVELLFQEAGAKPSDPKEIDAAKVVAESLDGLPLALELAGAYLKHRDVSWLDYLDLLKKSFHDALEGRFLESFTKHEKDLYSTLKIGEAIYQEEPKIRDIIRVLTWSGSAPMSRPLLETLLGANHHEVTGALGLGVKLKILVRSISGESYSLHRLVQQVMRDMHPLAADKDVISQTCKRIGDWFQSKKRNFSDLAQYESDLDHLSAWQANAERELADEAPRLIWLQAYPAHHRGKDKEALKWIQQALSLFETRGLTDLPLKGNLLNDLGTSFSMVGRYEEALRSTKEALNIRLSVLGELNSDTAMAFHNLGTMLSVRQPQENLQEAETNLLKAYEIWKKIHGEEDINTAMVINHLGCLYDRQNRPEAIRFLEKGLNLRLKVLGELHPDTARSFVELGSLSFRSGLPNGLKYLKRSLEICEQLLGCEHKDTIKSLNNVVNALCASGQHAIAAKLLNRFLFKLPSDGQRYLCSSALCIRRDSECQ